MIGSSKPPAAAAASLHCPTARRRRCPARLRGRRALRYYDHWPAPAGQEARPAAAVVAGSPGAPFGSAAPAPAAAAAGSAPAAAAPAAARERRRAARRDLRAAADDADDPLRPAPPTEQRSRSSWQRWRCWSPPRCSCRGGWKPRPPPRRTASPPDLSVCKFGFLGGG
eukprot:scaffold118892_cov42-Phaeocystis_antarctica.AAC.2